MKVRASKEGGTIRLRGLTCFILLALATKVLAVGQEWSAESVESEPESVSNSNTANQPVKARERPRSAANWYMEEGNGRRRSDGRGLGRWPLAGTGAKSSTEAVPSAGWREVYAAMEVDRP